MSQKSLIQWTDGTWSPVLGCSPEGPGCGNCYAKRGVWRMAHHPNQKISGPRQGLVEKTPAGELRWTGKVALLPEQLDAPRRWRKPQRVFVANQSDLFHPAVPDEFIARVFGVMSSTGRHTFQVLTKRAERMRDFLARCARWDGWITHNGHPPDAYGGDGVIVGVPEGWPLANVHLGYSASTEKDLEKGLRHLLATPAALRYLSLEPLLERVEVGLLGTVPKDIAPGYALVHERLHWVIVGGESSTSRTAPGRARPCDPAWIRSVVEECRATSTPVFVKQMGSAWANGGKGADPAAWDEDLRVREMPEVDDDDDV